MERPCPLCGGVVRELIPFSGPVELDEDRRYECESCGESFSLASDGMLRVVGV
jgi:hypothetical protein